MSIMKSLHTTTICGAIAAAITMLGTSGCSSVTDNPASTPAVQITTSMLPPINGDGYYELWFSYPATGTHQKGSHLDHGDAAYASIGRFTVNSSGTLLGLDGKPVVFALPSWLNANFVEDAILTVEPLAKTDTTPGPRLLSGPFTGTAAQGVASLTMNGDDAFDNAFAAIPDAYAMLTMPTTSDSIDYIHGIWFAFLNGATLTQGISLPALPVVDENPHWHYQTWIVPTPLSSGSTSYPLGTFTDPAKADADGAGPAAGPLPQAAYSVPGQDFAPPANSVIMNDGRQSAVLSLEPDGVVLHSPLVVLNALAVIPATTQRMERLTLAPNTALPHFDLTLRR